jgi:lactate dehydrogenase-like 2-hydroxyacid dehydrogenase
MGCRDAEILQILPQADAIVLIGHPVTAEMITVASRCRLIMTLSVGFDVVDVVAATNRGIPVSNCPLYCSEEVAQHAITLALTVGRKIHELIPHTRDAGGTTSRLDRSTPFGAVDSASSVSAESGDRARATPRDWG